jgi:hypothetical protein
MNRQDATGAPFKLRGTEGQMKEPSPEVDALATSVIDAAIEVHRHLGPGFLESVCEAGCAVTRSRLNRRILGVLQSLFVVYGLA